MINGHDFYMVLSAMMPLYVAIILAYGSVRWWKIFTPDQCAGINRFVFVFAIPFLCFTLISKNNPYAMNLRFIAADTLQKIIVLAALIFWARFTKRGSLDWLITFFPICTLPNNLVIGIPLLVAMYGEYCQSLMVQIVVLQFIIWYSLLLFLFEYRAAKILIVEQFPNNAGSIESFKVDSDVISLDGNDYLETDTTIRVDGKLHVSVRNLNAPRPKSFSGAENSSFERGDLHHMTRARTYPKRNASFGAGDGEASRVVGLSKSGNEQHMLARGSNEPPVGDASLRSQQFDRSTKEVRLLVSSRVYPETQVEQTGHTEMVSIESITEISGIAELELGTMQMPRASMMARLIMVMMWRKLIRNPNTYSSLIGLIWSLIHFRWNIEMPIIIDKSIALLSDAGLGMAMFTIGLFMALQPSLIPCGKTQAIYVMAARFITGPAVMAAASFIIGIRGDLLKVAIVQAALPQGILPFVFAKEYNLNPQILCTSVIFGMVIALPATLVYYILLGL